MTATDRLATELEFHNRQAADRARYFDTIHADYQFDDDTYLNHETWIKPAIAKLGNLKGKDVLDFGCGHGMAAVVLARAGARVCAMDLSPGYVQETQKRAVANGVTVKALVADGEALPFADGSFSAIWGNAILHHLNLTVAGQEIRRVLQPGGIAVFCEPWGGNPMLNFARRWLPYASKERTPDELPLRKCDLPKIKAIFPDMEVEGHQLFAMVRRVIHWKPIQKLAERADRIILNRLVFTQQWCRYVTMTLRKP